VWSDRGTDEYERQAEMQPQRPDPDDVRPVVGELRHTSAGNVYRLERIEGEWRYVRRVSNGTGGAGVLWDAGVVYRWHAQQWEEGLPLVGGDTSGCPHFGLFMPR
jgi:hypothetical protein